MARPIVLSNGRLHVGLNSYGLVDDFYYPYVGAENHTAGGSLRHKIGVWVDGAFSWLDDGSWSFDFQYIEGTLIGVTSARNEQLKLLLEFTDAVDSEHDIFMRAVHVVNNYENTRSIKIYFHQVFVIGGSYSTDTCQYIPESQGILHYKAKRYFMVGGKARDDKPFSQYAIGLYGVEGHEGSHKDAEDGQLSGNAVEQGQVDSVIGFELSISSHDSSHVNYWITAGKKIEDVQQLQNMIQRSGVLHHLLKTDNDWQKWSKRARSVEARLPQKHRDSFLRSIMLVKSHIDQHGGVVASTDTSMLHHSRDSYAYVWPRDAAYSLWPLMRLGYTHELMQYFDFATRVMHKDGYLMHKYLPDGSTGPNWHPYTHGDNSAPPIQEDETALTIFLFGRFYSMHKNKKLLEKYYSALIKPMADFMSRYIDPKTGLPLPSYDIWEQAYLTSTYTTASVYGALVEATTLAETMHQMDDAVRYRAAAEDIRDASDIFYNQKKNCFIRGFVKKDELVEYDTTVDAASAYGIYMFGLMDAQDARVKSSFAAIKQILAASSDYPAIGRFENDEYNRVDSSAANNLWFVASLWIAQYEFEAGDEKYAMKVLEWVRRQMLASGVLSEQSNPKDLSFVSVAPLTWSQAEYANCVLDSIVDVK